jgi:gamma-glutamyl-gamma-aminobutyrate hydrolase PuuD
MRIAIPLGPEETQLKLNNAYVDFIAGAGYEPMTLNPHNDAMMMAELCDGLLLPGGKDIDPIFYGESNWGSFWADSDKDDFERKLFWAFVNMNKPIFGVCRGFQLIAREYIKTEEALVVTPASDETVSDRLVFQQDIGSHDCAGRFNLFRTRPHHYVTAREDALYGTDHKIAIQLAVNSMHHQYLHLNLEHEVLCKSNKVSPHMRATGWTVRGLNKDDAGVVCEAIQIKKTWKGSKIAAVQWHPEELKDYALLNNHFGKAKSKAPEMAAKAAG